MMTTVFTINIKKLNQKQVLFLIKEIKFSNKSIKELAHEYNISLSTLYNIKNRSERYLEGKSRRKYTGIDYSNKLFICDLISGFVNSWRKPYTLSDLSRFINHNSDADLPYHKIREVVKSRFNMTYKESNRGPSVMQILQPSQQDVYFLLNLLIL